MKKLSLVAALLALAGAACGSDSDKKSDTKGDGGGGGGNNNGDNGLAIPDAGGGEQVPFPECPRDEVDAFPDYEGEPVWTSADQMACATACGMVTGEEESAACIEANCPDYEMFNDCVNGVLLSCLTADAKDGDCRGDWETYICCAEENCGTLTDGDEQQTCLDKSCKNYIEDVGTCIDENSDPNAQIPDPCIRKVFQRCIKPAAPMGDAGTMMMLSNPSGFDRFFLRNVSKQITQLRSAKSAR